MGDNVIRADRKPPIIETIGQAAMLEQMALSASDLSVAALRLSSTLRGQNPACGSAEKMEDEIHRAFNLILLCAEYLGVREDDYRKMVSLYHWHAQLERAGKEDRDSEDDVGGWVAYEKFKPPGWMEDSG